MFLKRVAKITIYLIYTQINARSRAFSIGNDIYILNGLIRLSLHNLF